MHREQRHAHALRLVHNLNLWYYITRAGGHIGWPMGARLTEWTFMRRVAWEFIAAVV